MLIEIDGNNRYVKHEAIVEAVYFFAEILLPRHMNSLEINISLVGMTGQHGSCSVSLETKKSRPRIFDIEINNRLGRDNLLQAIAHELVHVKQYVKKELYDLGFATRWDSKLYDINHRYWDQPWEIEAYGREVGLMHRYLERYDGKNTKYTH